MGLLDNIYKNYPWIVGLLNQQPIQQAIQSSDSFNMNHPWLEGSPEQFKEAGWNEDYVLRTIPYKDKMIPIPTNPNIIYEHPIYQEPLNILLMDLFNKKKNRVL